MSKIRVYEYAKQLNMSSKEIISILKRMNVEVNNHMSMIGEEEIQKIQSYFDSVKRRAAGEGKTEAGEKKSEKKAERDKAEQEKMEKEKETKHPKSAAQRAENERPRTEKSRTDAQVSEKEGGSMAKRSGERNRSFKQNRDGQRHRSRHAGQRKANGAKSTVHEAIPIASDRRFDRSERAAVNAAAEKPTRERKSSKSVERDRDLAAQEAESRFYSRRKTKRNKRQEEEKAAAAQERPKVITYTGSMTVGELAEALRVEVAEVIKKLLFLGVVATKNQNLDKDAIELIASEYDVTVEEKIEIEEDQFELLPDEDDEAAMTERPPVVTIMGHVDHGKTTLLDAIRQSRITEQEAGGITQHIGAYQVTINDKKITFLDTPGHEAFTSMRARGAQVTDITVLVVAADDGVMPQTVEAINHAKAAGVPIIVAVNKIDKPEANPDRVKQELTEHNLIPEEWGGDTIFVHISALKKQGIDELLEMILLVAEMQELKANPNRPAKGVVIEAKLDKGRGPVATVLVQQGTLRVGDAVVVGNTYGRVRAMTNDMGKRVKEATPSTPVEITGLNDVPNAGDPFRVFEDEKKARQIAERRAARQRQEELSATSKVTLDDLYKQLQEGQVKELNVIVKADVHGSVEALRHSLEKIDVEGARVRIIHSGVGAITETDVNLAVASNAIIIGFNVRPQPQARALAEQEKVDIRLHRIIYECIEEIESAMKGLLEPVYQETVTGTAEVRQIFKVSKIGTIAGCYVTDGKITRAGGVRVIRDGVVIYEGKINSLKRFKDDVKEVSQGYECGLTIENFNDIKEGDQLECFVMEAVPQ